MNVIEYQYSPLQAENFVKNRLFKEKKYPIETIDKEFSTTRCTV